MEREIIEVDQEIIEVEQPIEVRNPMAILYDPLSHIRDTPIVIDTPDYTCTFVYKLKESVLACNDTEFS